MVAPGSGTRGASASDMGHPDGSQGWLMRGDACVSMYACTVCVCAHACVAVGGLVSCVIVQVDVLFMCPEDSCWWFADRARAVEHLLSYMKRSSFSLGQCPFFSYAL